MKKPVPAAELSNDILASVDLPSRGQDLISAVKSGLNIHCHKQIASHMGLEPLELSHYLGISRSTFYRRLKCGRFSCEESDRIVRAAVLFSDAVRLFENDQTLARRWIRKSQNGLNGQAPIEFFRTGVECEAVRDLIGRLEMGVFC